MPVTRNTQRIIDIITDRYDKEKVFNFADHQCADIIRIMPRPYDGDFLNDLVEYVFNNIRLTREFLAFNVSQIQNRNDTNAIEEIIDVVVEEHMKRCIKHFEETKNNVQQ